MSSFSRLMTIVGLCAAGLVVLGLARGPGEPTEPADRQLCAMATVSADTSDDFWCDPVESRKMLDQLR